MLMKNLTAQEWIDTANQLVSRLEKLSADSRWAHRASGVRGSLLHSMQLIEICLLAGQNPEANTLDQLNLQIEWGYQILNNAAREITVPISSKR